MIRLYHPYLKDLKIFHSFISFLFFAAIVVSRFLLIQDAVYACIEGELNLKKRRKEKGNKLLGKKAGNFNYLSYRWIPIELVVADFFSSSIFFSFFSYKNRHIYLYLYIYIHTYIYIYILFCFKTIQSIPFPPLAPFSKIALSFCARCAKAIHSFIYLSTELLYGKKVEDNH